MANSRDSAVGREYATVDTAPDSDSDGYFTNAVNPRKDKINKLFFSIREATAAPSDSEESVITVRLQFQCNGDPDWTTFVPLDGSTIAIGNRLQIDDWGSGVKWRAGVHYDDYTSGSVTFGFDW